MLKIEKVKIEFGYEIKICTEEGWFKIFLCGNFDLYWDCSYKGNILEFGDIYFNITKENYYLYSLFDELYNNIKNHEIISDDKFDNYDKYLEFRKNLIQNNKYNNNILLVDDCIEWHSDDFCYDVLVY